MQTGGRSLGSASHSTPAAPAATRVYVVLLRAPPTLLSGIRFQAASSVRLAALLDSPLRALFPLTGSTLQAGRRCARGQYDWDVATVATAAGRRTRLAFACSLTKCLAQ